MWQFKGDESILEKINIQLKMNLEIKTWTKLTDQRRKLLSWILRQTKLSLTKEAVELLMKMVEEDTISELNDY
jgi:hypothetical protein